MAKSHPARQKEKIILSEQEVRMSQAMGKAIRELKRMAKLTNTKLVVARKNAWSIKSINKA
jgi:hypothetical protein